MRWIAGVLIGMGVAISVVVIMMATMSWAAGRLEASKALL